jgi:hypothetical protein
MASSDLTVLRYVKEVTAGVTPATPALKQIRFTGESLNFGITNTQSAEIRPDRTEADTVQTEGQASGAINFELSFDSYKDFLEASLGGAWTAGTGDLLILKNGSVMQNFSIQKHFQDMAVPQFHTYKGVVFEGFNLKMELGKIIAGDFQVMGRDMDVASAQIAGATFVAAPTTVPMNAVANLQNIVIDGVPYSGCINMLDLSVKNNIRAIRCIGSIAPKDHKFGTIEVTGNMDFYFNDGTNYAAFRAGTEFDFAFDIVDAPGNKYSFDLPRCKFESGEVVAGGKNSDVMFKAKWRALYDATTGKVMSITADPV